MSCFQRIIFTFNMFMIIGVVKGRWLEVEPYSTSSMISDGVDHKNPPSYLLMNSFPATTLLDGENRCQSIYGFLPCADTVPEGMFLLIIYMYLMMLGEDWIRTGSQALFLKFGDVAFGASVFRLLMALPRIVLVFVSGVVSTESTAQNQVASGISMYAGSTLITLTFIWGFQIILSRDKLRGKGSSRDSSTNGCWSLTKHKLSHLNDTGVNIDKGTKDTAVIMLLSLIPFATVELVALVNNLDTVLFALVVSGISLVVYFVYQIGNPWIQVRISLYLKQEHLRTRFIFHIQRLAEDILIDENGHLNMIAVDRCFKNADKDEDGKIQHDELERFIKDAFESEQDNIFTEYVKSEILTYFDDANGDGELNFDEFIRGCEMLLEKWKEKSKNSNSAYANLLKQVEKLVLRKKHANLTNINIIMPRIIRQVLQKRGLVKDNKPDKEKIEELFSQYDANSDEEMQRHELKQFIESLGFGISLDHDTTLDELIKEFGNETSNTITKSEFVEGFLKWIEKAINYDPNIKDLEDAITKFEEDSWAEIVNRMTMEKSEASIVYVVFGVGIIYLISGAFTQSVLQISNAAHIPFNLASLVVCPMAMTAKMVITSLLNVGPHLSKNASLTISEIYNGLVMNNLLGLFTSLITVYMKKLSWTYTKEVLIFIMIPCAIVGLFALKRDAYPLWASILAMLLYPMTIGLYYVCYTLILKHHIC